MIKHIALTLKYSVFFSVFLLLFAPPAFSLTEEEELRELSKQRLEKAIDYYNDEGFEEAIYMLRKIRGKYSRSAEVQYYLGLSYKGVQEYSQAITHLLRASKKSNDLEDIYLHIAQCQYFSGKYEKASRTSAQAIKNSTNPGRAHMLKGLILLKKGSYRSSIKEMIKAETADDNLTYQTEYYKAIALVNLSRFKEAKEAFRNVIQAKPDSDLAVHAEEQMSNIQVPERRLSMVFSIRHEEDDNVYLLPDFADFPIVFEEEDRKDYRQAVTVALKYKLLKRKTGGINTAYSFYGTNHGKAKTRDLKINTFVFTPYISNKKVGFTVPFVYQNVELHNNRYMDVISATPTINTKLSKNNMFSLYGKIREREMRESPSRLGLGPEQDRDGLLSLLGLSFHHFIKDKRGFFNFGLEGMKDLTHGSDWEYVGTRAFIGAKIPFRKTTYIEIKLDTKNFAYENRHSAPNDKGLFVYRDEDSSTQNIKFTTAIKPYADFVVEYTGIQYDSNFDAFIHNKEVGSVGIDLKY